MTQTLRRLWSRAAVAGLALFAGAAGADAAEYVLKVSHAVTIDHPANQALELFKQAIEEKSDGAIEVRIFHSSQLAGQREGVEGLQAGTIEMTLTPAGVVAAFDPTFGLLDIPFQFANLEHAHTFLDTHQDDLLLQNLPSVGLVGLAVWEQGFRNLGVVKAPVKTAADVQGIKLRTMQAPLHITAWKSAGVNPTPIGWAQVYTSLQQGVIDGVENPSYIFSQTPIHEQIRYLTITRHIYDPVVVLGSKAVFDQMPEALRALVKETLRALTPKQRELANADVVQAETVDLPKFGVEIVEIPDAELAKLAEMAQPPVLSDVESRVGAEAVARWTAAVDAARPQ